MNETQFIDRFAGSLDDVTPSEVSAETCFRDLESWSSMQALVVIAMIDEEYDVLLSADDLGKARTVGDLFRIVEEMIPS